MALFADTVHNFSDALTAVPLWIAFAMSRRAATRRYTYGFGRVEDLAGLFVVAMIAFSAVVAAVEAVRRLIDPVPLAHLGWVAAAGRRSASSATKWWRFTASGSATASGRPRCGPTECTPAQTV